MVSHVLIIFGDAENRKAGELGGREGTYKVT